MYETIDTLCAVIEKQAQLIRWMAAVIEQSDLSDELKKEVAVRAERTQT